MKRSKAMDIVLMHLSAFRVGEKESALCFPWQFWPPMAREFHEESLHEGDEWIATRPIAPEILPSFRYSKDTRLHLRVALYDSHGMIVYGYTKSSQWIGKAEIRYSKRRVDLMVARLGLGLSKKQE